MSRLFSIVSFLAVFAIAGCSDAGSGSAQQTPALPNASGHPAASQMEIDHHSFANPREAMTRHLNLDLTLDFGNRVLKGVAKWEIENYDAQQIIFDTRDLLIDKVTVGMGDEERAAEYTLSPPVRFMGQALNVKIDSTTRVVNVYYRTNPEAAALDWLDPQLTSGKKQPFLFTQGQAILTRSWIPCQDSPGIRITYTATVRVPPALMAVMSATNPQERNASGIYQFSMEQPIPPYLLALAVGDLQFREIGARTGVYAEPELIDASANEFADMEQMLIAAENLYGAYLWDRYDVIVLPPSFPFGGMENPRLTFATPTIIAGDRSLTALIAHELAHSWSGNLVTNATWNDFWLNEGFTVYFERRIMEALYGQDYADMLTELGYQDLLSEVEDLKSAQQDADTRLMLNLRDRDPDDGMTDIAYEKGAFFLKLLEESAGRDTFDAFLKAYFEDHQFETMTTERFVDYLKTNLLEPQKLEVDIDAWIYQSGIPDNIPAVRSERFRAVEQQLEEFLENADVSALNTESWSTHEWLHFIRRLPSNIDMLLMKQLDNRYQLSESGNSEILAAWFEQSIYSGYSSENLQKIQAFLSKVGRRKFLSPLYRAFKETDQLEVGRQIFEKARENYHSVSRTSIAGLLDM